MLFLKEKNISVLSRETINETFCTFRILKNKQLVRLVQSAMMRSTERVRNALREQSKYWQVTKAGANYLLIYIFYLTNKL